MKKIKLHSYNNKQTLSLPVSEIEEIKATPTYDKLFNKNLRKAGRRLEDKTYFTDAFWKDLMKLALAAFIVTIAMDYFISATGRTGIFPGGLGAFARFLSVLTFDDTQLQGSMYFVYYLALNIPFFIFGLMKLGIRFTIMAFAYISFAIGIDQMITHIPVINPGEWKILIDFELLNLIPGEWSSQIWLFVFALFGGLLMGLGFTMVYRTATGTGGVDFVSIYISRTKNKNIGKINMNINFVIVTTVVILNTIILSTSEINETFRYSILYKEDLGDATNFLNNILINGTDQTQKDIVTGAMTEVGLEGTTSGMTSEQWFKVSGLLAENSDFSSYTTNQVILMKLKFILGPTLFATFVFNIVQGLTINYLYPKNQIYTYFISTIKPEEVEEFLFNAGYQNNVFTWSTNTSKKGTERQSKTVLMVQMTVLNWRAIEAGVLNIDERMNINAVKTSKVLGPFSYPFDNDKSWQTIMDRIHANPKTMKKLEQDSIIKTYQRLKKIEKIENHTKRNKV